MNNYFNYFKGAISIVFSSKRYLALGVGSFAVFFVLYAFLLPATYTGGRVGLVSLQFLNLKLGLFAFVFSLEMSFIVPFTIYAFSQMRSRKFSSGNYSFLGSILPPLLCCSPVLPSFTALLGGIFPFVFSFTGFLQGFIATHEVQIYIVVTVLLVYSLFQNAKQAVFAKKQICC